MCILVHRKKKKLSNYKNFIRNIKQKWKMSFERKLSGVELKEVEVFGFRRISKPILQIEMIGLVNMNGSNKFLKG